MPATSKRIGRKLQEMMLLTSSIVLAFGTLTLFSFDILAFKDATVQQLQTLGRTIATNSGAALAFDNPDDAQAVLAALQAEPHIRTAALYDRFGKLFTVYPAHAAAEPMLGHQVRQGYRFERRALVGVEPVMQGSRFMGTLLIESDLGALYERLELYGATTALVIVLGALLALAISSRLRRHLSTPILSLADTARVVSEREDYSVRASPGGDYDELNTLTESFNHMLTIIGRSEGKLLAQLSRLKLLHEITRATGDRQDLQSIFLVVLNTLEKSLPIDFGCMCLYNAEAETLTVACIGSQGRELFAAVGVKEQGVLPIDENGLSCCVKGALIYEPDTRDVQVAFPQRLAAAGLNAVVFAPLAAESKVFGLLIAARREAQSFTSPDCEFLKQLCEHVALASNQAQLYEALQQAYDDLRQSQHTVMQQERLRALGQMASGIAHDINNALSPVSLYTDSLLEREPGLSDRGRQYLTTIQRAIDDVAATVARMREFYRPREVQLELAEIHLNHTVSQVVQLTQPRWRDLPQQQGVSVDLRTEFTDPLPSIMGAESEIRDALTNLIFNAVDALPKGGTVTVRTTSHRPPDDAQKVQIEVIDNGVGMDEDTRRRCLEPFYTTKGERGTGLGLPMVYGMVQRHSAALEIDSSPGVGTTMRLIFAAVASLSEDTQRVSIAEPMTRRLRILLVDDDPLLIKALTDSLEEEGHVVVAATGGQAGIDTFAAAHRSTAPFNIVITDLGMPQTDGRKVAATIKGLSPITPVILLTGWGQRLLADNEIPPYVNRVLSKPPRLNQLRAALSELAA